MRATIPILLALMPAAIIQSTAPILKQPEVSYSGPGRGKVNPPTIYEMSQAKCLATMVYGEARGESVKGKVAVAYTALNRAGNKTICEVVLAPKQYSIFNDNPSLRAAALSLRMNPKKKNVIEERAWEQSVEVAKAVLNEEVPDPTNGSTHYLAPEMMKSLGYIYPQWSKEFKLVAVVDNHHFYKPVDKKQMVAVK